MNESRRLAPTDLVLRLAIVGLTLATAFIHWTLGGLLFTLCALGYLTAAVAMVVPLPIAIRFRWLVRIGLIGYTASVIASWYVMGPRYDVAYLTKAIEIALIGLVALDFVRYDGNPLVVVRHRLLAPLGRRLDAARP